MIVAIDGPVGAGKSTVARQVATRIGAAYLDTGAMYRAVALAVLEAGADPDDAVATGAVCSDVDVTLHPAESGLTVMLDGHDITARIREPEVSAATSRVAGHRAVRERLVALQRAIMARGDWVADGRDIGTVVCPDADLKVFLTAEQSERARRRHAELLGRPDAPTLGDVTRDLAERDARDAGRAVAPLIPASDAWVLDTTGLSFEEVVESIVERARGTSR